MPVGQGGFDGGGDRRTTKRQQRYRWRGYAAPAQMKSARYGASDEVGIDAQHFGPQPKAEMRPSEVCRSQNSGYAACAVASFSLAMNAGCPQRSSCVIESHPRGGRGVFGVGIAAQIAHPLGHVEPIARREQLRALQAAHYRSVIACSVESSRDTLNTNSGSGAGAWLLH